MRNLRLTAAAGLIAVAGMAGLAVNASAGDDSHSFVVLSHHDEKTFTEIDAVSGDFAPGDGFVGTEELTDVQGHHLGLVYFSGAQVAKDAMSLQGVLHLKGEKTPVPMPVLGGTGKYAGARGHADLVFLKSDTNVAKVTFYLQ